MIKKEQLFEIRTNTNMLVNYDTFKLTPEIELIFLTHHPEYKVITKKGKQFIEKSHGITEVRIATTLSGINKIIGQLQATAAGLQQMEQLSEVLNKVIEQSKKTTDEKS
jgi:hypothetical protein